MKTAEEWIEQYQIGFVLKPSDIHRIQLDAMKEGMRRSAEIADACDDGEIQHNPYKAILAAAKKVSFD